MCVHVCVCLCVGGEHALSCLTVQLTRNLQSEPGCAARLFVCNRVCVCVCVCVRVWPPYCGICTEACACVRLGGHTQEFHAIHLFRLRLVNSILPANIL